MSPLVNIIIASLIISTGALVGIFTVSINAHKLEKILILLVSLSAGALMGGAFLHLLPEASDQLSGTTLNIVVLLAFITFFFIEKLFHWRHCHKGVCQIHTFGYMNLFGDSIHNFIDGLILSAAFISDTRLGIITTLAIALHEIPQEIGDYGVLLYSGFNKRKALIANYLVALTIVAGGIVGYFLSLHIDTFIIYLLPFAAGGFIYISASDLIPEIRKVENIQKSFLSFGTFLIGISLMLVIKLLNLE